MNGKMSARGGSAFGGKKLLFLAAAVVFLAAACNKSQTSNTNPYDSQTSGATVDGTVDNLEASLNSENSINSQSDSDLLKQDQSVVNDASGVANANY